MSHEGACIGCEVFRDQYRAAEDAIARRLAAEARLDPQRQARVQAEARALVEATRRRLARHGPFEQLLASYDLSTEEGLSLMLLAEALLRIPDAATAERLVADHLAGRDWSLPEADGPALLQLAARALNLAGGLFGAVHRPVPEPRHVVARLVARLGERPALAAVRQGMKILAGHFVAGQTLTEARAREHPGERYTYDRLGESARTSEDADRYTAAYLETIESLAGHGAADVMQAPGVSIKLSALHPRFDFAHWPESRSALIARVRELALAARASGIGLTLDAEEAARTEPLLDVFETVFADPALADWDGFGLAVQAYQKRARGILEWLAGLGSRIGRRIPLRLVKGAYWDAEIRLAQRKGLDGYPVFTRKAATDVSYLACAGYLHAHPEHFHAQYATHNAHTVAWLLTRYGDRTDYEFQRLHGMGEALYEAVREHHPQAPPCRVYAPVGPHRELLPYLVRRLLENGSNLSFVNRLADPDTPVEDLIADPVTRLERAGFTAHPRIRLPRDLYLPERRNSTGPDLSDPLERVGLFPRLRKAAAAERRLEAGAEAPRILHSPVDGAPLGTVRAMSGAELRAALERAAKSFPDWDRQPVERRALCLERLADRLERHAPELVALVVREGGRCLQDAFDELREAVDFCRYYAGQARQAFEPRPLPGPAGERNGWRLHGRGVFLCASPWNFPLSIFTGQVAAALVAGNSVLAKPASATPFVAQAVVEHMRAAGVPQDVVQLVVAGGAAVSEHLLGDPRIAGVAMTGSTETAWTIQRRLAARDAPIVPLVAETGGINAMIADSSALPEQLVDDVIRSAFDSAGQRCSALRILFVQEDIAGEVLRLLGGAMDLLRLGDPMRLETDVGPVIDDAARRSLEAYIRALSARARLVRATPRPTDLPPGTYLAPHAFELEDPGLLTREVFGPILHVVRFARHRLDAVLDWIRNTGYGLTLGLHSRLPSTHRKVVEHARAGNLYINRDMIGAVVGVQPFGGEGLSGTGPKAGGPLYLTRFAVERVVTENRAAVGGDVDLIGLGNEDA